MGKNGNINYLQIPQQNLSTLSFCEPNIKAINQWVANLPMANIGETSRQLYHAIVEFNQLEQSPAARFEFLEKIRDPIHYVCQALTQKYLQQSLVLDESQRKVANLSQALQTHLATGYKILIEDFLSQSSNKPKEFVAVSIHRAISDLIPSILRSYQLYLPTPSFLWQELHRLYQTAKRFNLHHYKTPDSVNSPSTELSIQQSYLRACLLGGCQPNQLQKGDLQLVFQGLEHWVSLVILDEMADDADTFVLSPLADAPPNYRHLVKKNQLMRFMGINCSDLVKRLHANYNQRDEGNTLYMPSTMNQNLLKHLIQSWGGLKHRSFNRSAGQGNVEVTVGLTATHYHLAGEVGFYTQLTGVSEQPKNGPGHYEFGKKFDLGDDLTEGGTDDVWAQSFDVASQPMRNAKNFGQDDRVQFPIGDTESHPKYTTFLVNTSPRGYCLQWNSAPAGNLITGEIIGIKEPKVQRWNIGIVRWIHQNKQGKTQMGIELLSPNCQPCGIRLLNKTGKHGDYMRGLFIPEIKPISQPPSIIAPRLPFQVGHKVEINNKGDESKFQLIKRSIGTNTISLFQLRQAVKPAQSEAPSEPFENLWRQL